MRNIKKVAIKNCGNKIAGARKLKICAPRLTYLIKKTYIY